VSEQAPVGPDSLWRNRDFNLLWTGQILSDIGSTTAFLAVPLLVLSLHGSATEAGLTATVGGVVRGIARLPGGALADRWNRRTLLLGCDLGRLVVYAALAVLVGLHHVSIPVVIVAVGLTEMLDVLFSPAEMAALSSIVAGEQLTAAFARNEARSNAASLAGPPLGGLLYGVARAVPFAFNAATFLVSFFAVAAIRRPLQPERSAPSDGSLMSDIVVGVRHVVGDGFMRTVLLIAVPLNFAVTGVFFIVIISLRQAGQSATVIGLAQALLAVGGFLGAFAAPAIQKRLSFRALLIVVCWVLLGCLVATIPLASHVVMVVPLAVGLFIAPAANAALFGRIAATTPGEMQGRVMSVVLFAATTVAGAAPLACGAVIGHGSAKLATALCAAALVVPTLAGMLSPALRLPDPTAPPPATGQVP
jgi:predicted MFS family arabinose efflux permease